MMKMRRMKVQTLSNAETPFLGVCVWVVPCALMMANQLHLFS